MALCPLFAAFSPFLFSIISASRFSSMELSCSTVLSKSVVASMSSSSSDSRPTVAQG
eukprot:CAMPEP_0197436120 /NCGR_PEP_ID=MMETSP1175-20131217/3596_1 /TAXON_ID=1003142 /ORGANISM="Triceratium dubium, Strain CCMP147" /LENGTH=56 /DNA_ID=CAMNT_0042965327 /DNA_START=22 /DNA_END=192 /DNA_ORIENTATION=+